MCIAAAPHSNKHYKIVPLPCGIAAAFSSSASSSFSVRHLLLDTRRSQQLVAKESRRNENPSVCEKLEKSESGAARHIGMALVAVGSALLVVTGDHMSMSAAETAAVQEQNFQTYFGTAASASSYGGYGGNASKKDSAEYTFDVPEGWKERLISKVEKGTNGTDTEFYNPRRKEEKVYLTFLAGFGRLAPRENVLNNLALSDVNLQDMLSQANSVKSLDRTDSNGQLYYEYEIDSPIAHSLISVTCAKNKLYAHFVKAPVQDWSRDESLLRHIHNSFTTVGVAPVFS
ncbi:hypothetical protein O6H91_01G106700 [Diphasiastrum complanatum]|nr:hypothetical protein O6H91_01G106700 [Diphasiastrum complanatum]